MSVFARKNFANQFSKYDFFFILLFSLSVGIKFLLFPTNVPLSADALYYFWYSADILQTGKLPTEWSPLNNGWPLFVSIFFSISDSKDIFSLMQLQKILSTIFSSLLVIPVYYLCKRFVSNKFALVGAALIAFEPRLLVNSFLGIADPLYFFLIASSLVLFMTWNKKLIFLSFTLVSLATIVRGEGIIFFLALSVLFLIKFRNEHGKIFLKYLLIVGIFIIIIVPVSQYRIEASGSDGIFLRGVQSADRILTNSSVDSKSNSWDGVLLFLKYFAWVLIPNFIILVPVGIILILKNRTFEKWTIIISLCSMSIPAFYAYSIPALDTRYLYVLFPMLSVLSVLAIEKISNKIKKENLLVFGAILAIFLASFAFYEQQKIDHAHEIESFKVMQGISPMIHGTNILYQESSYLSTSKTIEEWPSTYSQLDANTLERRLFSVNEFESMEDFISQNQDEGLTHIIIDNKSDRKEFLKELFKNETKYSYLKKIYDSKQDGFSYELKVFEIDFKEFSQV